MQQIVHMYGELHAKDEKTLLVALDGIANIIDFDEFDKVAMVEQCGVLCSFNIAQVTKVCAAY